MVLAVALLLTTSASAQSVSAGGCTVNAFAYPPFTGTQAWLLLNCPETAWFVVVQNTDRGLQVGPAYLQRAPGANFILVLNAANVAENFTPYHTGNPSDRISDTRFCAAGTCIPPLDANDLGPNGIVLTVPGNIKPTIAVELHDRGIAWMCKSAGKSHTRRGMEMVIWGGWDPGNYDYTIQYIFRDDGQISFRAGASGWDNEQIGIGTAEPHMHDILWRVDIQLGSGLNTPYLWTHYEASLPAYDTENLFNSGHEGAMDLDELRFATLIIEDSTTNAVNHPIGYEVQPFRAGTARHYGAGEGWSLHDTWVTRFSTPESLPATGGSSWTPPDDYLLGNGSNQFGVFNQESVVNQDIVLWHVSSAHHEPHDEDQAAGDTTHGLKGLTLMHWSGFDLVPHNLFDTNPLGGPHRSICDGAL
jgi:primary-amine oxidase